MTSHYVSGPVRFPVDLRLYRRYDELTRWEEFVHQHFPDREIPKTKKERARLHKEVDPVLLQDPEFLALHQQFCTKIELAIELLEVAMPTNCHSASSCSIAGIWPKISLPFCAAARRIGSAS